MKHLNHLLMLPFALRAAKTTSDRVFRSHRVIHMSAFSADPAKTMQRTNVQPLSDDPVRVWTVGEQQPGPLPSQEYQTIIPGELSSPSLYALLIGTVVPRPIALITSQSEEGVVNCAPFSYFNMMSHDPPLISVGFSTMGRERRKKDTLNNIEQTGEFVVNIMSSWFVESANYTCGTFSPEVDEMEVAGLSSLPSTAVKAPRVGESAVQFECKTELVKPFMNDNNEHTSTVVIARIVKIHVHQDVLTEESKNTSKPIVDWKKLQVVGRLGGNSYTEVVNSFDLARPDGKH